MKVRSKNALTGIALWLGARKPKSLRSTSQRVKASSSKARFKPAVGKPRTATRGGPQKLSWGTLSFYPVSVVVVLLSLVSRVVQGLRFLKRATTSPSKLGPNYPPK